MSRVLEMTNLQMARCCLAASVGLLLSAGPLFAGLQFTEPVAYAGVVRSGPPLVHRFEFSNTGPETVAIAEARASCGCLKPQLSQLSLQPGEKGHLVLEVNTLSQAPGPHTWAIHLHYQCGSTIHEAVLQLSARLITEVMVQPAAMVVFAERADRHEIIITDLRPRTLSITAVNASSPRLQPRLSEPSHDMSGHWLRRISLEVADDYPQGRHDEILEICSSDPDYPSLRVPVTIVKCSQQFTATPGEVTLTAPAGQAFPSRIVLIRNREDRAVVIDKIDVDDPAIVCRWAPGPNSMATVRISVNRSLLHGSSLQSAVNVRIGKPVQESLTIPVKCGDP
jgi:hypothetical protein